MADILHLDLYRKDKPLKDLIDPCSTCVTKSGCTCERAHIWWSKLTQKFKRQSVINKLGGE